MSSEYFSGYIRPNGDAGVRNYLLVLSTSGLTAPAARRTASALPGCRLISMPFGGGLVGNDRVVHLRSLAGFGSNPNVGAVILLGSDAPRMAALAEQIRESGKPVSSLCLDHCGHDSLQLTGRAIREGAILRRQISRQRRESIPLSKLFIGTECGRSDPSSGLIANPIIGRVVDAIVQLGGRAVFGETLEWLGAEHLLQGRAATTQVRDRILHAVNRREGMAVSHGISLTGNNPNPTNVAAGLSTIEEKSLGAITKSGSSKILDVLEPGQRPSGPGLFAMDAPSFTPESLSGFVAAGTQLLLFSTGVGNSYVSTLAPTIKLSANPEAALHLAHQLDFDASGVLKGKISINMAAAQLMALLVDTASGSLTWGEVLDEGDEVISRYGEAL
jgi:altronate dehydratase large subunit